MNFNKIFKYILFILIIGFVFNIKVYASTNYLLCEYTTTDSDAKMLSLRYIFKDGSFEIGGGMNKNNKWKVDDYKEVVTLNNKKIIELGFTNCPKNLYYNQTSGVINKTTKKITYTLSSKQNKYKVDDLTCHYGSGNLTSFEVNIPSGKLPKNVSSTYPKVTFDDNVPETINRYITDMYINMPKVEGNWQDISMGWYYIPLVSKEGCPYKMSQPVKSESEIKRGEMTVGYQFFTTYYASYDKNIANMASENLYTLVNNNGITIPIIETDTTDCGKLFGGNCENDALSVTCFVEMAFKILKIILPMLLIVLGSIDFSKVVISQDKDAMPKAISNFIKRVIMAIFIYLLPGIIQLLAVIFNNAYSTETKWECIIENLKGDV